MKDSYNIEQVAQMAGLSTRTIRTYIAGGFLEGSKEGGSWHFSPEQLERFLADKAIAPAIRTKRNAMVYDFIGSKPDGSEKMCVILDLPPQKLAAATAHFCKFMNAAAPASELHFAADGLGKGGRVILSGSAADVMEALTEYYGKHTDE